jgi:lipoprotein NlpI
MHQTIACLVRSVVLSLLLGSGAACLSQEAAVEDLLAQATQASQRGEHRQAIERLSEVISKAPEMAEAWYLRGREHFCASEVEKSVADFDKYVALRPKAEAQQWERGISYYYAGEFAKGAKQFELYQTFHNQDVENAAWRYLCVARAEGIEKAQATLLPIASDPRLPMMEIYELYRGKLKPADVFAAIDARAPSKDARKVPIFYAHLYVGLWHEASGRPEEAKTHILEAEKHKIAHYMWDVAHVHAERLRKVAK